jgi:hypothetical protein
MNDSNAMVTKTALRKSRMDFGLLPDQEQSRDTLVGLERANRALNDHATAMVSPHDIDGNAHIGWAGTATPSTGPGDF